MEADRLIRLGWVVESRAQNDHRLEREIADLAQEIGDDILEFAVAARDWEAVVARLEWLMATEGAQEVRGGGGSAPPPPWPPGHGLGR